MGEEGRLGGRFRVGGLERRFGGWGGSGRADEGEGFAGFGGGGREVKGEMHGKRDEKWDGREKVD